MHGTAALRAAAARGLLLSRSLGFPPAQCRAVGVMRGREWTRLALPHAPCSLLALLGWTCTEMHGGRGDPLWAGGMRGTTRSLSFPPGTLGVGRMCRTALPVVTCMFAALSLCFCCHFSITCKSHLATLKTRTALYLLTALNLFSRTIALTHKLDQIAHVSERALCVLWDGWDTDIAKHLPHTHTLP